MHGEAFSLQAAAGCSGIPAVAGSDTFRRRAQALRAAAHECAVYQPFVLV